MTTMTTMTHARFIQSGSLQFRDAVRKMQSDAPAFMAGTILLAALVPVLVLAGQFDDRLFNGINVWIKPAKFAVALSIYLATLAFFARYIPERSLHHPLYRAHVGLVMACIAAEMIWIAGAAAYGTGSHFNVSGPVMAMIYPLMGLAATLLTSATLVQAVLIARNPDTGLAPVLKEGIVAGLALTLPLTLITAGTMSAQLGHGVGGSGSDAGGMALMGWLRDGGDLRVAHFFATHAMHAVPVMALISLLALGPERKLVLRIGLVAYAAFVLATFAQALAGQPFLGTFG